METEFVVRDPARIASAETTIRAADQLLKILDETSERIGHNQTELADAFDAIADVIQAAVVKHTGVDVRKVGSTPIDEETGELALRSIRVNLGYKPVSDDSRALRNQQQLVATSVQAYRDELAAGNNDAADRLLGQALATVDLISSSYGEVELSNTAQFPSKSIVLVEQDRDEREMLQHVLTKHDFDVRSFSDDESALEFLLEKPRDATVLLNIQHADVGNNSIRRVRNHVHAASMRVIGMSSMPLNEAKIQVDLDGVQQWFQKPFDTKVLLETLRSSPITSQAA